MLRTLREGASHSRGTQVFSWYSLPSAELLQNTWMKRWNKATIRTVPTLLMGHVKQWLAMAAFRASIGHRDSLQYTEKKAGIHCLLQRLRLCVQHCTFSVKKAKVSDWDRSCSIIRISWHWHKTKIWEIRNKPAPSLSQASAYFPTGASFLTDV